MDDESPVLSLRFLVRLSKEALKPSSDLTAGSMLDSVTIYAGGDQHSEASFSGPGLDTITLSVTFGAENAAAQSESFDLSRQDIARSIFVGSADTLRDMLISELGVWRQDLIDVLAKDVDAHVAAADASG